MRDLSETEGYARMISLPTSLTPKRPVIPVKTGIQRGLLYSLDPRSESGMTHVFSEKTTNSLRSCRLAPQEHFLPLVGALRSGRTPGVLDRFAHSASSEPVLSEVEVLRMTACFGAVSGPCAQKLFGGWMRSRATVGDASKGRSSEPCSGCYRASAVGFLSEIHKGVGLRQSAKQLLKTLR